MKNPKGLENGFSVLPDEAYTYLERSGALFGTPIERLRKMNIGAIELYADHDIDLYREYLEIVVCAQHCNGGVMVDENWQSDVEGLYVCGEAAGTFGVYRPGGSALNSTQVGSLRAAEHIASKEHSELSTPEFALPEIKYGKTNISTLINSLREKMSRVADFDRRTEGMKELFSEVSELIESFFDTAVASSPLEIAGLYRLYDMALTQRSALSAMILAAEEIGTHGGAMVNGGGKVYTDVRTTRTLTRGAVSEIASVSPIPDPELWFETLLARQKAKMAKRS